MIGTGFESGILHRLLGVEGRELPPEVASFFLGLSFTEADHERVRHLSEKANDGNLTPEEREELSMYVLVGDMLTILHSRARASKKSPAA